MTNLTIDDLAISARLYNALANGGLKAVRAIVAKTHDEIKRLPGIGNGSFLELKDELERRGIDWPNDEKKARRLRCLRNAIRYEILRQSHDQSFPDRPWVEPRSDDFIMRIDGYIHLQDLAEAVLAEINAAPWRKIAEEK